MTNTIDENTFQQYMQNIANVAVTNVAQQLNNVTKHKIHNAYIKMYCGFVMINWSHGETLGKSMYTGMKQSKSFIDSRQATNPAVTYLRQIQAAHNVAQAKQIMTHPGRDTLIDIPMEQRAEYNQRATSQTQQAMSALNSVIAQFREYDTIKQQTHQSERNVMQDIKSRHGSMAQSAQAANAKHTQNVVNPSKSHMISDEERQMQREINPGNAKMVVEPENGSMMKSATAANNKLSIQTPNPSKKPMMAKRPALIKDNKSKTVQFKNAKDQIKTRGQNLTPEQQMMLWRWYNDGKAVA